MYPAAIFLFKNSSYLWCWFRPSNSLHFTPLKWKIYLCLWICKCVFVHIEVCIIYFIWHNMWLIVEILIRIIIQLEIANCNYLEDHFLVAQILEVPWTLTLIELMKDYWMSWLDCWRQKYRLRCHYSANFF